MALTKVTLTGTYLDGEGSPLPGTVSLVPSVALTDITDGEVVRQSPVEVTLNTAGQFSVPLYSTDSTNLAPSGWAWQITEEIAGLPPSSWSFFLLAVNGGTQDISTLTPVVSPVAMSAYLPESGGTLSGPVILNGSPPLIIASGASAGKVLTSDGSGHASWGSAATGTVTSVTAGDTSIVVGGTGTAPTLETGTLDVIAADHPPAGNWSNNSHKITSLADGSSAQDAATFHQIPTSAASIGGLTASNNLSDVGSASTSRANLGLAGGATLPTSITSAASGQSLAYNGTAWQNVPGVWNVRAFGAKGDGTTVDSTSVQNAVAAALAAGAPGGVVYFPPGTYVMSNVTFGSAITVMGAGMGATVLLMDPSATTGSVVCRVAPASSVTSTSQMILRDLTIDGNKATWGNNSNQKGYGFYCGQSTNGLITHCKIINVEARNCLTYGLDIERVQWVSLTGCDAHDNGYTSGTGTMHNADGFTLIGDDITATDCRAWSNAVEGFRCGQSSSAWHRVQLVGCEAWSNGSNGASLGSDTTPGDALYNSAVIGGAFYSNTGAGIYLTSNAIACTVSGASSYNNTTSGVLLSGALYCTISGCTLKDNATAASTNPEIYLSATSTNNTVTGNTVTSANAANAVKEQNSSTDYNTVTANNLTSTGTAVVLAGTHSMTAANVGFDSPPVTTASLPLAISSGGTGTASGAPQNDVFAGPTSGTGAPAFRALVAADVPTLNQNTSGTAAGLSATLALGSGGTGQTSAQTAMDALAGATTSGDYLRGNGSHVVMAAITSADLPTGTTGAKGALQLDGTGTDIAALGTQAAGATGLAADAGHVHAAPQLSTGPSDIGYAAWNADPLLSTLSITFSTFPVAGNVALARLDVRTAVTVSNIWVYWVKPSGGSPANNYLALFNGSGTQVGSTTSDFTATSTGLQGFSIGSQALSIGTYYVAYLCGTQGGTPGGLAFLSIANSNIGGISNAFAQAPQPSPTAAHYRFARNGTSASAITAPLTLSSNSLASLYPFWCALA